MNSKAICVLGVHRSGTSMITRGINLLGAWLGHEKDLMIPKPDNPEGFWERYDLYHLHEHLLNLLGHTWETTTPLPINWHTSTEISPVKDTLKKLVKREFSRRPLWVWKDPRTCLLMPLWKEILAELDTEIKVVFAVRNPLDVARSLEKRNGFPIEKGLGIWFNYTYTALQDIKDLDTVFVSYDRFLEDWETELKKCAATLALKWPQDDAGLKSRMAGFLKPDLRHSESGIEELIATGAAEPVIRIYKHLLEQL